MPPIGVLSTGAATGAPGHSPTWSTGCWFTVPRREALVPSKPDENASEYLARVRAALDPSWPLAIRVGPAVSFTTGQRSKTGAVWANVGTRSDIWQKVTTTLFADTYAEVLTYWAKLLDEGGTR